MGRSDPRRTILALMAIAAGGAGAAVPMARVARNDYTLIGRLLDEGAMGIVVPMVDTPEEAQAAAEACRFPPSGTRSWGWGRAGRSGDDYADWINEQVFVAVQIESAEAVRNAEAIMATPALTDAGSARAIWRYRSGSPPARCRWGRTA